MIVSIVAALAAIGALLFPARGTDRLATVAEQQAARYVPPWSLVAIPPGSDVAFMAIAELNSNGEFGVRVMWRRPGEEERRECIHPIH